MKLKTQKLILLGLITGVVAFLLESSLSLAIGSFIISTVLYNILFGDLNLIKSWNKSKIETKIFYIAVAGIIVFGYMLFWKPLV